MPILNLIPLYFSPNGLLRTTTKSANDMLYAALDTATLGDRPKEVYLNGIEPCSPSKEVENSDSRALH